MEYSKIIAEVEDRFSNPCPQNFPLPWDLMKYIQKEWSPEVYQKLTRACKHFYFTQPWMVIDLMDLMKNFPRFRRLLNEGLKKNFKIWVVGRPPEKQMFYDSPKLTSEARFVQLLHSIRFSSVEHLLIINRKLSYSDYIILTEFKSVKCLSLAYTNVTTKDDVYEICFLDDLLKPLNNIDTFFFESKNGSDYYLECVKRIADFVVPQTLRELIITEIPEYISFEYFYLFLKKNSSLTRLELRFQTTDINNAFVNDVQSFYTEKLTYETSESVPSIHFRIFIGNLKIHAVFYKICKKCNQGVGNKFLERRFCPSDAIHWVCETCFGTFQPGGPCTFCLAGV